jgi:N-acyl-D-amino-acid deacylase
VHPDSLFRIASVSKPFTAVAVLKLVEQGRLDLDARPFELLELHGQVPKGRRFDERWQQITVRHLLHHTGGWDRDKSFDPMFRPIEIAKELDVPAPAGARDVIRYMLGQPLDFDPGTRYAYSNFGYCVLGRVIEKVSGERSYDAYVKKEILEPIGIHRMRVGASLEKKRAEGEVHYYTSDSGMAKSVFPGTTGKVPRPYGGFHLEAMDAHGGWIASVLDLARFAAALDDPQHSPLIELETFRIMYEPPAAPVSRKADGTLNDFWYGCGWMVRPMEGGKANYWHNGSLPGTYTLLVRRGDGVSFAALFNQRSNDWQKGDAEIDSLLHRAVNEMKRWPTEDLFGKWAGA